MTELFTLFFWHKLSITQLQYRCVQFKLQQLFENIVTCVFRVSPDGNCLFGACSLFLVHTEELATILRLLTSLELYLNAEKYTSSHPVFQAAVAEKKSFKTQRVHFELHWKISMWQIVVRMKLNVSALLPVWSVNHIRMCPSLLYLALSTWSLHQYMSSHSNSIAIFSRGSNVWRIGWSS